MEQKRYFPAADHLRGIAIISVLLYHGIIEYPIDLRALYPWCDVLFGLLASFHMPLFFILSGFVYSCREYGPYIKKRALRLLAPYLVFGGGSVLLHVVAGSFVNGSQSLGEGLKSLLLYGSEYWFLYTLFVISAVFPLLDRIPSKWTLPAVILFTVLIEPVPMTRTFILNKNFYYLGYFALGVYLRRNIGLLEKAHALLRKRPALYSLGSCALFFAVFGVLYRFVPDFAHRDYILAVFGCTAVASVCTAFELPPAAGSFLRLCGKYSLQLYLLNGYLLVVGRSLIVGVLHVENPVFIVLALFVFCLAAGLFISGCILDRCRLFRLLSGIPERAA